VRGVNLPRCVQISVVPDPDFWIPIWKIFEIFLDPEPDWISFLLKPDPDPVIQNDLNTI